MRSPPLMAILVADDGPSLNAKHFRPYKCKLRYEAVQKNSQRSLEGEKEDADLGNDIKRQSGKLAR